jgi:hypothetical protein
MRFAVLRIGGDHLLQRHNRLILAILCEPQARQCNLPRGMRRLPRGQRRQLSVRVVVRTALQQQPSFERVDVRLQHRVCIVCRPLLRLYVEYQCVETDAPDVLAQLLLHALDIGPERVGERRVVVAGSRKRFHVGVQWIRRRILSLDHDVVHQRPRLGVEHADLCLPPPHRLEITRRDDVAQGNEGGAAKNPCVGGWHGADHRTAAKVAAER